MKIEASVKTKGKRVAGIEAILTSVFWIKGIEAIGLGNELEITREETWLGGRKVRSRKRGGKIKVVSS